MAIEIVDYRHSWKEDFAALQALIVNAAPAGSSIHHIGSTAVEGLPAKDIIDIQVSVDDLSLVDGRAFESVGFRRSAVSNDHMPARLNLPAEELRKILFKSATVRPANVHVREKGRYNQRYALLCRDFLRTHSVAAQAYGQIKQRLAVFFPEDEDAYYDLKDPVFDIIVDGATEWAKGANWVEPASD